MYIPTSSVIPGLNIRNLVRTGPDCNVSPDTPPGAVEYAKNTKLGVTASLSITPSSLQTMLKVSPEVGTPGILTQGVKAALLRAIINIHASDISYSVVVLTFYSQFYALTSIVV